PAALLARPSQRLHERDDVLLLLLVQLQPEDQVEVLNRVVERQQTTVMQVRRRILDAAKWARLGDSAGYGVAAGYQLSAIELLGLQVVHQIIRVERRLVTGRALRLAEEQFLPALLGVAGF